MSDFQWIKQAEQLWDKQSEDWNSRSKVMWDKGSRKDIIPFLKKYVNTEASICDLGCGDGYGSKKLAEEGYKVTGIDVSEDMIHKARLINTDFPSQFLKGDIARTLLSDDHYDAVMAINSLEWTESPLEVIREIKRILKAKGHAIVGILGPTAAPRKNSYQRLYGEKVVCNTMMPWEFERLALENGLKKMDELGVYKKESEEVSKESLPVIIKQSLSFMWVFILVKE